jgi:DNA-binding SARP family transcriptional activator
MNGSRIARHAASVIAAAILLALLWVAWGVRPALPALPASFSRPLTGDELRQALALLAWALFVLLDLVVLVRVVEAGARRRPSAAELRLRRAFAVGREPAAQAAPNWRAFAAPLEQPVLRLAAVSAVTPPATATAPAVMQAPEASAEDAADEERFAVRLLGPVEIAGADYRPRQLKTSTELTAYLALRREGASRDEILEALWPGEDPARSQQRFWQATAEARKLLPGGLSRKRDRYTLDRNAIQVDLDEFEELIADGKGAPRPELRRERFEQALALFRGEALEGIDADWAESEARRLRSVRVELLEELGRLRLEAGDSSGALEAAERGIALDDLNESLWRLALEAEGALGLRQAVMDRYETLRRILDERLGLQPQRETRALSRQLLGQE